jgi:deazaflavin-dependent oxidoreductase (nitroreductase family)
MSTRRHKGYCERTLERIARTPAGYWYLKRIAPRLDPPLLRLTGGRISSVYPATLLLLTTVGVKSGLPRTVPLLCVPDCDRIILVASNYGGNSHPSWYRNLIGNPTVEVLAGRRSGTYLAREITEPDERERAWSLALDRYAGFDDYEKRATDRTIPLVRLERADGEVCP